ncbi:endo alpha-1,4 polygalactosaminidase [Streptomyces sp. NPDC093223]|uniref:endo alpha-1,4 polygalactosaminidase n=1 Tax=Streptomyces sp. NPDC093223 TaxID=3366033 RepID=UPI0038191930
MPSRKKRRSPLVRVGVPVIAAGALGASVWGFTAANAAQPDSHSKWRHAQSGHHHSKDSGRDSGTRTPEPTASQSDSSSGSDTSTSRPDPTSSTSPAPSSSSSSSSSGSVKLPPTGTGFDYQIGGAYTPPAGVGVVSRDNGDSPAKGLYNICYINAFQSQPGDESKWTGLLLEDKNGQPAEDPDWEGEYALDISTQAKREALADKMDETIDSCASKGFDAIEPDNYDSYQRFDGLTADEAESYMSLLVQHAHAKGLAVGQKNTVELAPKAKSLGIDFAVTEECGAYSECADYEKAFGDHVVDIEYTGKGLNNACADWSDKFSIVQRDEEVSTPGKSGYVRETCG